MAFCELQPLTPRSSTCCKPRGEETTAGSPATAGGPDPPVVPHPGAVAAFPPTADQPTLKDVMAELRSLRSDVTSVVTKVEELDKRQNANYLSLKLQIETLAGRVGLPKFAPAGWFGTTTPATTNAQNWNTAPGPGTAGYRKPLSSSGAHERCEMP
eukprot:TRINITY_DN4188_c0_g1_i1.p1 TRINITY_DN4188_c0_g1~~TRINITY_DN4188_c0_g1_i1.p1  ORF type:complete len:170 (-),score=15.36 TRINITY_DN4188_c0_g1_i1:336-803(-)